MPLVSTHVLTHWLSTSIDWSVSKRQNDEDMMGNYTQKAHVDDKSPFDQKNTYQITFWGFVVTCPVPPSVDLGSPPPKINMSTICMFLAIHR